MTTLPFLVDKIPFVATIKPSGRFSVVVSGQEYEAGTLAGLRKKLKDVKSAVNVALPVTVVRYGGAVDGMDAFEEFHVVSLVAGSREFMVRDEDGRERGRSSRDAFYRRVSREEKVTWVYLARAATAAQEALDAFVEKLAINVEVEFKKLVEVEQAKS